MCGILARFGNKAQLEPYLKSLKELEYRGYDSYGFFNEYDGNNNIQKQKGTLTKETMSIFSSKYTTSFLSHTRWATHGRVTPENAHPHFDFQKRFFVVMNGIIENYLEIKHFLEKNGYEFISQTDTEIIPQLFAYYYDTKTKNLGEIAKIVSRDLKGDFSYVLFFNKEYVAYKNKNPLILGITDDEVVFSSDFHLIQELSDKYCILEDGDIVCGREIRFTFLKDKSKFFQKTNSSSLIIEEDISTTYMEKEILDQKKISSLFTNENQKVISELKKDLNKYSRIFLIGSGSSYHSALIMHYKLLSLGILSQPILACELSSYMPYLDDSLIIAFSQSGETADIVRYLENCCGKIYAIVNTPFSTLDRIASKSIYLNCGKEISVASTKAFFYQVGVSYMLANNLIQSNIDTLIKDNNINYVSNFLQNQESCFLLGRNDYYPLALEGALKLKETTYINAQGFAGGELKHGSLALIEEGTPAIILGDDSQTISNAQEIKTRGGIIIGISNENKEIYDYWIKSSSYFQTIVILQLIALYISLLKGINPDKPRNLAKSCTVL